MIPLDLPPKPWPPKLWTPPALILPSQAETLDRALARGGIPRHIRRAIEREIARTLGARSADILARAGRDQRQASMPVLLALLAARRRGGGDSYQFKNSAVSDANETTYTFPSLDFGTPAANRWIVFTAMASGSAFGTTIDLASAGGVSATEAIALPDSFITQGIYYANVPTGATGAIAFTNSTGKARAGISWWVAYGDMALVASGTDSDNSSPGQVTVSTAAGGVVIAAASSHASSSSISFTGVTERFDEFSESANGLHAGGDAATDGGSTQIDATFNGGTSSGNTLLAAAFSF